jgi:hypothetical protein
MYRHELEAELARATEPKKLSLAATLNIRVNFLFFI